MDKLQEAQEVMAVIITNKLLKQKKVYYDSVSKKFIWKNRKEEEYDRKV